MIIFALITLCIIAMILGAGMVVVGVYFWIANIQDMIESADYE